jgi:multisubunit Na+/H+ antiporter MnhB subunit
MSQHSPGETTSIMTRVVARLLLAPTLIAAIAILVKGYVQTGDGFAAGAVAALGIAMQYLAFGRREVEKKLPVRGIGRLSYAGLLIGLTIAVVPLFLGDPILTQYPPPGAEVIYLGTLELITAVAFDLGIFLVVLGYGTGVISLVSRLIDETSGTAIRDATHTGEREETVEEGRTL